MANRLLSGMVVPPSPSIRNKYSYISCRFNPSHKQCLQVWDGFLTPYFDTLRVSVSRISDGLVRKVYGLRAIQTLLANYSRYSERDIKYALL
jgi:hypothetical protein